MLNNKNIKKENIKIFETFAGIGAQHKAITNIDKDKKYFEVVKTSEWDARAIIAYSQIHNKNKFEKELKKIKKLSIEEVDKYFLNKIYSLDSKKPSKIIRKPLLFKQNLMAACKVNNNFSDIRKVSGKELIGVDLLTYSFPCQGLSIANMGRGKGIKENSDSTSNLIWQIKRILEEAQSENINLPKYLLMENVRNLLSKKHINDYKRWKNFLKSMGYTTKTIILDGLDHGSIQKRKRVFGISILNWDNKQTDQDFYEFFQNNFSKRLSLKEREINYKKILKSSSDKIDEINDSIPNNTKSRVMMMKNNDHLLDQKLNIKKGWIFRTLTTKQDRHPNIGMVKIQEPPKDKLKARFITPREAYLIMGFTNNDFQKVKNKYDEGLLTKESMYRQAGNSIVVSVLESIFKYIKFHSGEYNE